MNILILLIGSNPLPNYVVASYLMKSGRSDSNELPKPDKIIMVHSEKTKNFAENIINKLENHGERVNLENYERDPKVITKKIQKKLREIGNSVNTIHLNYVGGTKPMSVHGYIAVNDWVSNRNIKVILSDLDPDNHKIILKNGRSYPSSGDLLDNIHLDIATIIALYGMGEVSQGQKQPYLSSSEINGFAKYPINKLTNKERSIYPDELKKQLDCIYGRVQRLKNQSDEKKERHIEKKLNQKFNELFEKIKENFNDFEINDGKIKCPKLSFIRFFKEGGWLEDFVLNSLIKLNNDSQIRLNLIKKDIRVLYKKREAQIDIIAIQGYKLFLISCTTDYGIKTVKLKVFEALYRAEQLGGEHAKVIVVSAMDRSTKDDNLDELEKDLAQFDANRNCSLIGIDELKGEVNGENTLTQRLKKIITGIK